MSRPHEIRRSIDRVGKYLTEKLQASESDEERREIYSLLRHYPFCSLDIYAAAEAAKAEEEET